MKPLVETDWLNRNLDKVKIFDATWHLPNQKKWQRKSLKKHIEKTPVIYDGSWSEYGLE